MVKGNNEPFLAPYRGQFNSNNYLLWLVAESDLLFLTLLLRTLSVFGCLVLFAIAIIFGVVVVRFKLRSLKNVLQGKPHKSEKVNHFLGKIIENSSFILFILIIIKIIFPADFLKFRVIGLE